MRVLCVWKEGTLIGEREPREDGAETHGLCPDHRQEVEEQIAEYRRTMKRLQEKVDP